MVPEELKSALERPVKCSTPLVMEYRAKWNRLSKATQKELDDYLATPSYQEVYESASGKFRIHYSTSGSRAIDMTDEDENGIPDYLEQVAFYADSTYRHEIERLGFLNPVKDEQSVYPIYLSITDDYTYGQTVSKTSSDWQSYIELRTNYENFGPNTDPMGEAVGALKVTIAHEFKHAIHFMYDEHSYGAANNWLEMDATLMEEEVFDDVNDYYNYLDWSGNAVFPDRVKTILPGSYGHITWALYFRDRFGMDFWVDVWDIIRRNEQTSTSPTTSSGDLTFTGAMKLALENRGADFKEELLRSHFWHYAAGSPPRIPNYGFEEQTHYPRATLSESVLKKNSAPENPDYLEELHARYYEIVPQAEDTGRVLVGWIPEQNELALGMIARFNDGTVEEWIPDGQNQNHHLWDTGWRWEEIAAALLVTTNTTQQVSNLAHRFFTGNRADVEQLLYGDVDNNDSANATDVMLALEHLTQQANLSQFQQLRGEVSGNGALSPYDASLILQAREQSGLFFPADENQNFMGPDAGLFQYVSAEDVTPTQPAAAVASENEMLSKLSVEPRAVAADEDTISLDLNIEGENSRKLSFSSLLLEFSVDGENWSVADFSLTGQTWASSTQYEVNKSGDKLLLAIASADEAAGGDIGTLRLTVLAGETASLSLTRGDLDEQNSTLFMEGEKIVVPLPEDRQSTRPDQLTLNQNYPNPFNPVTNITYQVPREQRVSLAVYNIQGKIVATLLDDRYVSAGQHEVTFNGSGLASGVYFYRLVGMNREVMKKMVLVK